MSNNLFSDIKYFKKCISTLTEKNGLLDRRDFELHEYFKDINFNEINEESSYYLIGKNNKINKNYIFIYFINTTSFLSKSYKNKNINILDCNTYIKKLYNINNNKDIKLDIIIIFTKNIKINNIIEKKLIEKLKINNIQIFSYKNLLFNITKHNFIPKHIRIISDKNEINDICKLKNIDNVDKLAKINITDPLSNFYGIKIGELFEFKRNNINSGTYIYYRLCVS